MVCTDGWGQTIAGKLKKSSRLPEPRLHYIIFFEVARSKITLYNFFSRLPDPRLHYIIFFEVARSKITLYNFFSRLPDPRLHYIIVIVIVIIVE